MVERLVVIGGDAAGMAAASHARRGDASLEIIALERGRFTSYSACGIPYLVGGDVEGLGELVARTPDEFRARQRIDVRMEHEVVGIDVDARSLEVRDLVHERTIRMPFDQLLIGTGARPMRPDLPGIGASWVHGVQTLGDAERLMAAAHESRCRDVVVVGAGYIGLEMAEAFHRWGARVVLIDSNPTCMARTLDPDMGELLTEVVRGLGIEVRLGERVQAFEKNSVITDKGVLRADIAVLGLGVQPNSELAGDAGIKLGARNAIEVDARQHTATEGVWAAGDCADTFDLVARRRVHIALGTVANRAARVAGINLGGGYARFPGVVGTAITKVCEIEVARTGLTESAARRAGFDFVVARIEATTKAGYLPDAEPMTVKMLAERGAGRVLGAQIVGGRGAGMRIDTVATALHAGMTAADIVDLDLAYAPPFSSVWDPVQAAARHALRLL